MHRVRSVVLVSLLACLISISGGAQQPSRDPQAVHLLQQVFVSMGGTYRAYIADVRVAGTLALPSTPDTPIGTFIAKARGLDFSIETVRSGAQTSYRVLRGFGSVRSGTQTKSLAPYNTTGLALDLLPLLARWTEFVQPSTSVGPVGQASLDGISYQRIRVESSDPAADVFHQNAHGKTDVLIDPSKPDRTAATRYQATLGKYAGHSVEIANRFTDYSAFGSLWLPTRITRYIGGHAVLVLRVQSVTFNNGFQDSDFQN